MLMQGGTMEAWYVSLGHLEQADRQNYVLGENPGVTDVDVRQACHDHEGGTPMCMYYMQCNIG